MKYPVVMLVSTALATLELQAQTVPRPVAVANEEAVQLSEFRVNSSTDRGYVATQAAGATRANTPLIELAHTVNVLNKELIQDTGAEKLYDVARYLSGITGGDQRNDGDFGAAVFAVRGFAINRQRDGLNVTSAAALVELSGYERVEFVKGASAVQTGSSNPGGVLNYVPKRAFFRNETVLNVQADTDGLLRGTVDANRTLINRDGVRGAIRVVATAEDGESFMDYQYRRMKFGQVGMNFRFGRDTSLLLRVETQQEKGRESVGIPYVFFSATSPTFRKMNLPIGFYRGEPSTDHKNAITTTVDVQAEHRFNADWTANFSGYFARAWTDRAESFLFPPSGNDPSAWTRGIQLIPSLVKAGAAEFNILGNVAVAGTKHQVLVGLSLLGNDSYSFNERWNYTGSFNPLAPAYGVQTRGPKTVNQSTATTNTYVGGYVQDTARLFDERLILGAGFRWDYNPNSSTNRITNVATDVVNKKVSPRYSALYRLTKEMSVYSSYNQSFQPAPAGTTFEGVRFQPLPAEQYEAGVKHDLFGGKLSGNVAVFQLKQENAITANRLNPGFGVQGGVTMSNGYETDLAWRPLPGWQLIGGFSRFKFRRNSEIEQVVVVPNRLASEFQSRATLWTKYDFREGTFKNLGLGMGVIHEDERFGEADRRFTVPSYTVFNGLVTYRWGRFKAAVNIENIFDQRYVLRIEEARTYNPGAPRALKFSLSATY